MSKGKPQQQILATGSGSWISHIEFDGKVYWKLDEPIPKWMRHDEYNEDHHVLPSDSSHRQDSFHIKKKNFEVADQEKHMLEEL